MTSPLPQSPGIRVPPRVAEGGVLEIEVGSRTGEIFISTGRHGKFRVPVRGGRAEFRVPPNIPGGTILVVSDLGFPVPTVTAVEVVSNQ
ncbi:MAG: hypothetical protein AB7I19_05525 [Planctomycetota bacterium]